MLIDAPREKAECSSGSSTHIRNAVAFHLSVANHFKGPMHPYSKYFFYYCNRAQLTTVQGFASWLSANANHSKISFVLIAPLLLWLPCHQLGFPYNN